MQTGCNKIHGWIHKILKNDSSHFKICLFMNLPWSLNQQIFNEIII